MDQAEDNTAKEACRTTLVTEALGVGRGAQRGGAVEHLPVQTWRRPEDLSDMEVERLNRLNMDGARDAAKEAARACAAARTESNTATCAEPTEVYASNRRMPIDDDVDRKRIKNVHGAIRQDRLRPLHG